MDEEEYEMDDDVEVVDDVTDDEATDDYLNEILTESQPNEEEPEEFEKNKEGITGDEWKDEEKEKLIKEIKEENKRNAERRIRNKKQTQQEEDNAGEDDGRVKDEDLDKAELERVREQAQYLSERMNVAAPVMDYLVQNQIGKNELMLGVDFVNNWRTDKIGCVKKLLTALENSGIDIGQIVTHDDTQLRVMDGVNQRMQPVMQQRMQEQRYAESKKLLDGFLAKYPDAGEHLEEITQVMQQTGRPDPYDAYFRLRRAYSNNNQPWFAEEETIMEEEEEIPQITSPRADNYAGYQPQSYRSIDDVVASEARKFFRR